jgi:Coenzyme PQQ synthesis protein D (PqqD)
MMPCERDRTVAPAPRPFIHGAEPPAVTLLVGKSLAGVVSRHAVCDSRAHQTRIQRVYLYSIAVSALSESLPVARPGVVWVKLPDGAVLFVPETEVYYGMNVVATSVWELLPQAADKLDNLCCLVQERFPDAELDQIRADVVALLDDLERAGLTEASGAQPVA